VEKQKETISGESSDRSQKKKLGERCLVIISTLLTISVIESKHSSYWPVAYPTCRSVGSRAPPSSRRPLLSLAVSICLSPVHPLPVDRFGWNFIVRTHLGSNSLLLSFIHLRPLAAELWTKNLIFTSVTRNATPPTVLNPVFWYFGIMVSYVACIWGLHRILI